MEDEFPNFYNRYREKANWSMWEIRYGVKRTNAQNPFSQWDQPQLYAKWVDARKLYLQNPNAPETKTMSNKDQLYKYGEQYVKRLATDSKGQAVVEDASTSTIFAVDPSKLELVVPYTVGVKFYGGNDQVCHYLAVQGSVEKGDILVQSGVLLKLATVVEIDTKSLTATTELKNNFPRKLKSEAL